MVRKSSTDVRFENHSSIFLARLLTQRARDWVEANVQGDAQYFGDALVVEPRYVRDLAHGMSADGLEVN